MLDGKLLHRTVRNDLIVGTHVRSDAREVGRTAQDDHVGHLERERRRVSLRYVGEMPGAFLFVH